MSMCGGRMGSSISTRVNEFTVEFKKYYWIVGVILCVSIVELYLVERKFGVFYGGFGTSLTVDTPLEFLIFTTNYVAGQALFALFLLKLAEFFSKGMSRFGYFTVFTLLVFEFYLVSLNIKFQIASYFSDAISFNVVKNLGGGSVLDAILFVIDEVVLGLSLFVVLIFFNFLFFSWARKRYKAPETWRFPVSKHYFLLLFFILVTSCAVSPRVASESVYALSKTIVNSSLVPLMSVATDFDRDGYGLFERIYDVSPFDSRIYPYSLEVTGNKKVIVGGFDAEFEIENVSRKLIQTDFKKPLPNVVIVVFESTRMDVFGKRINGIPVAPNLEKLVSEGSLVAPMYSHVGFTTNSLKSIFSGELITNSDSTSIFDDLKKFGYKIAVFSGQSESFGDISATVKMQENSDIFVDAETLKEKRAFSFSAKGSLLLDEKYLQEEFDKAFANRQNWDSPVFLYFNFQSAHFPYYHDGVGLSLIKKPIARSDINMGNKVLVSDNYWNAVAHADQNLGLLISKLKNTGVWNDTILFVTSDHGEELYDNGFLGHGHYINFQQNAIFLASNRPGLLPYTQLGLSDFRDVFINIMNGDEPLEIIKLPFIYVGNLDRPSQIGLAGKNKSLTTFKFDTRQVCFVEINFCENYSKLKGLELERANFVLQRWVSEVIYARNK